MRVVRSSHLLLLKLAIMSAGEGIRGDMLFARHIDWIKSIWKRLRFEIKKSGVVYGGKLLLAKE